MKKVFISYKHSDESIVDILYDRLKDTALKLFLDKRSIEAGKPWSEELQRELSEDDYLIPCLSDKFNESDWCKYEVDVFAKRRDIKGKIIPLKVGRLNQPIPGRLSEIQYIDVSTREKLEQEFLRICRVLGVLPPIPNPKLCADWPTEPYNGLNFIGRVDKIWEVHDKLQDANFRRCILSGIGGVGKTQVAFKYMERFGDFYKGGLIWIEAERGFSTVVGQICRTPGIKLNIDYNTGPEEQLRQVWRGLRNRDSVLVVYDNLPDTSPGTEGGLKGDNTERVDFRLWCPPETSHIHVLATTRRQDIDKPLVNLDVMKKKEAIELLNSGNRDIEEEEAGELADLLGYLPLVLFLASKYLNKMTGLEVRIVIENIRKAGAMDQCKRFADKYKDTLPRHEPGIPATFQISYEQASKTAKMVLHCMSLLAPERVPLNMIQAIIGSENVNPQDDPIMEAIDDELSDSLGLIDKGEHNDPKMHRLIIAFIHDYLHDHDKSQYDTLLTRAASYINHELNHLLDKEGTSDYEILAKVLPHAEKIGMNEYTDPAIASKILLNVGRGLEIIGDKDKAVKVLNVSIEKAIAIKDDLLRAKAESNKGVSLMHSGFFSSSMDSLNHAEGILRPLYDKECLDMDGLIAFATCLDYIGENYREQNLFDKASDFHKEAIKIASSKEDVRLKPKIAHAKAQLGALSLREKDYETTLDLWKRALDICKEVNNKPWTAHFSIDVGFVYLLNRQFKEAKTYLTNGTKLAKEGNFNDNIARGLMNTASLCFVEGKYKDAEDEYKEALRIAEKNHVVRLVWRIKHNLGNVMLALGDTDKAIDLYKDAIRDVENLRDNYENDEKRRGFMEHRFRPYQTMIMIALGDYGLALSRISMSGESKTAKEIAEDFAKRSMVDAPARFFQRASKGLDLDFEEKKDSNFFSVETRGYFLETE